MGAKLLTKNSTIIFNNVKLVLTSPPPSSTAAISKRTMTTFTVALIASTLLSASLFSPGLLSLSLSLHLSSFPFHSFLSWLRYLLPHPLLLGLAGCLLLILLCFTDSERVYTILVPCFMVPLLALVIAFFLAIDGVHQKYPFLSYNMFSAILGTLLSLVMGPSSNPNSSPLR